LACPASAPAGLGKALAVILAGDESTRYTAHRALSLVSSRSPGPGNAA
jgi:hypothetical protein